MSGGGALILDHLDARYGTARVLFDVSLEVPDGSIVALLGRNGAGKSTTVKSIMRIGTRTRGAIRYGSHDLTRMSTTAIARLGVGYVPEDRRIFQAMTVRENLQLGRGIAGPDRPALELEDVLSAFPQLRQLGDRRGGVLSGGEQQLLAVARTLIGSPRLMLLDEPSEGLAPVVLVALRDAIRMVRERFGVTVLLAEQNATFALALAETVVLIDSGRIVHQGPAADLRARPDLMSRYLGVGASTTALAGPGSGLVAAPAVARATGEGADR